MAQEALKEKQTLAELAKRFEIHPTMIGKLKRELLERAPSLFSKAIEEPELIDPEPLYAKIGRLELENDYLKKFKIDGLDRLRTLIDRQSSVSIRAQCHLLGIHRSGTYYRPVGETKESLLLMRLLDERCLIFPAEGILQLQDYLRTEGYMSNHKRVR